MFVLTGSGGDIPFCSRRNGTYTYAKAMGDDKSTSVTIDPCVSGSGGVSCLPCFSDLFKWSRGGDKRRLKQCNMLLVQEVGFEDFYSPR